MTEAPIWPGVAEYLYHAASPQLASSEGTWIVPLELTPRSSGLESTPMAGISTDTGSERGSDSRAVDPIAPAAAREGCGACTWALIATPTVAAPPMMSSTPASPATRARRLLGAVGGGGGAYPLCGQETTTRNPAMRRHPASSNAVVPPSHFSRVSYSRSLLDRKRRV